VILCEREHHSSRQLASRLPTSENLRPSHGTRRHRSSWRLKSIVDTAASATATLLKTESVAPTPKSGYCRYWIMEAVRWGTWLAMATDHVTRDVKRRSRLQLGQPARHPIQRFTNRRQIKLSKYDSASPRRIGSELKPTTCAVLAAAHSIPPTPYVRPICRQVSCTVWTGLIMREILTTWAELKRMHWKRSTSLSEKIETIATAVLFRYTSIHLYSPRMHE